MRVWLGVAASLAVVAIAAIAVALFSLRDERERENCLAEVRLEYPAPESGGGGIGGYPLNEPWRRDEAEEEAERVSEEREEAVEAC